MGRAKGDRWTITVSYVILTTARSTKLPSLFGIIVISNVSLFIYDALKGRGVIKMAP